MNICKYNQDPSTCHKDPMNCQCLLDATMTTQLEQEPVLLPCPFCGHKPLRSNLIDSLHPTGSYTHYINPQEPDEGLYYDRNPIGAIAEIWSFGCLTDEGGCGAEIMGEGKDGVIKKWNTRTSPPNAKDFATLEKAIRVAAVMEAIKAIKPNKDGYTSPKLRPMMESIHVISEMNCEIIQTLITEDDKDALRDLMMKAVTTAIMEYGSGDWSQPDADAIVDRVLESK